MSISLRNLTSGTSSLVSRPVDDPFGIHVRPLRGGFGFPVIVHSFTLDIKRMVIRADSSMCLPSEQHGRFANVEIGLFVTNAGFRRCLTISRGQIMESCIKEDDRKVRRVGRQQIEKWSEYSRHVVPNRDDRKAMADEKSLNCWWFRRP
jgi:hypothetical protein